jgi:glycine cleavage system T protein
MAKPLPGHARVVIIGGGVAGCAVAYHLAKVGITDVVLLERKQLTSGTTWHAAGLIGQLRATKNLTELAKYTAELYANLEAETGQATGFKQNGSLSLAVTQERLEEWRRAADMAKVFGLEVEEISLAEAQALHPLINVDDLAGAVFLPKDGQINPADVTQAMAKGARSAGIGIFENIKVTAITQKDSRVTGVRTDQGDVDCDVIVNCAGMWGQEVGAMAGVDVPLHACEHFYVVTEPIDGAVSTLPVLRDQDNYAYYKEDAGKILLGAFEPNAKPWGMNGISDDFCFDELPPDIDHFMPVLERAIKRMPALETAGIRTWFCGPESFTPDDRYHLGETPNLKGFFVACGFNSIGIQSAGGVGKVLADWIKDGHPSMDLWDVDIRRNMPFQTNRKYLHDRVTEGLGLLYAEHWPFRQYETARGVRKSSLHDRLAKAGACFGETAGWERANWFAPKGVEAAYEYSYGRQNWFDHSAAEHRAVRENVGIFDLTSFAKFMVQGTDSKTTLNQICANNVDVAPGRTIYTQWLNERGGIEADLTVTRVAEDEYFVVSAGATQIRDFHWLKDHIGSAIVTDVTAGYAVLAVMGPKARAFLSTVTDADLSNDAFPFGASQEIDIGYGRVRATRLSYVGELGWELYIPSDMAQHVYDVIVEAGAAFDLKHAGYHALNSLRIEKAYRHWGHDIADEDTPLEAGLGFAVAWDKPGGFIGRDALLRQREGQREDGVRKRLVQFLLSDPTKLLYHNEPIWRDGALAGYITSAMYGHTLGGSVGLGYITGEPGDDPLTGAYEISVAGERVPATASLRPMYDPASKRLRG